MNLTSKSILIGLLLAVIYYLGDAMLDHLLKYKDLTFIQTAFTQIPVYEVYSRILGAGIILLTGITLPRWLNIPAYYRQSPTGDTRLSTDPALMVTVSNEIKSPLNAIIGFVELLKDSRISEDSRTLYLNHIHTSGKYLLELINNITDITLIETGTMRISREECQLNQMLAKLQMKYEMVLVEQHKKNLNIKLSTGVKEEHFTVLTDEIRLYQVLLNLVENALSFTDEGSIEIGYHQISPRVLEFYVKDTGTGLSPARLELLMTQRKKLGFNHMRPFDIVGLRMSIVRHLVTLFGGELEAESKLGSGSVFRFRLRVAPVETKPEEATPVSEAPRPAVAPKWAHKKVMIAEDVESNFVYLKEILKPTGIRILWAENGKEAVQLCRNNPDIDLVLMDILMPEMDGYEAAKVIKLEKPDMPILAQTAYNIDDMEYKDASDYFSKFMIKPIWSIDLLNTLSEYFDPQ